MASISPITMSIPLTNTAQNKIRSSFFNPLSVGPCKAIQGSKLNASLSVKAEAKAKNSMKEKAVAGFTAAALSAAMIIPDVAQAAEGGVTPTLKNFLLSIAAGGVVVTAIIGAIVAVSNFDPVKRG